MTNGINTTMNGVKTAGQDTAPSPHFGDASVPELSDRDDPVLAPGETGNEGVRVRFVALVPHVRN
jgi:hypothetical protein